MDQTSRLKLPLLPVVITTLITTFLLGRLSRRPRTDALLRAAAFSADAHKGQRRKNLAQTPYINHPIRVASLLSTIANVHTPEVLIAALLHDTVEDTHVTLHDIRNAFGNKVANIVKQVTDDKDLPKDVRKQLQIQNAPLISSQAKLVKLADKLDNLTSLLTHTPLNWQSKRVADYYKWAESVIAGLRGTNKSLEHSLDHVLSQRQIAIDLASTTTPQ